VGRIATYACDGFSAPLGWLPTCRHSCRARCCVKYPLVTQTPWPPPIETSLTGVAAAALPE
jgi:hypothetical protein